MGHCILAICYSSNGKLRRWSREADELSGDEPKEQLLPWLPPDTNKVSQEAHGKVCACACACMHMCVRVGVCACVCVCTCFKTCVPHNACPALLNAKSKMIIASLPHSNLHTRMPPMAHHKWEYHKRNSRKHFPAWSTGHL